MTDADEDLPEGGVFTERDPVDPYQELCKLLQRPRCGFAPFHDLLLCAEGLFSEGGWLPPDQDWTPVKLAFDQELADIAQFLHWSSRFQEQTPDFVESMTQAFSILEHLEWQSARLDNAVEEGDPVNFVFSLEQLDFSLRDLSNQLQALRELEDRLPKFSEIPYVQELFRLAGAVRRGSLEPELLAERLIAYEEVQRFVQDALRQQGGLSPPDLVRIEEAFALQDDGLDMLFGYLECGKVTALDKGLAWVQQAWDSLLEVRREMVAAQERAELPTCLRCGLVNPQGVHRCSACQARLPDQASFQISIRDCDEAVPSSPPDSLEKIRLAAARISTGEISLQQFAEEVENTRKIYDQAFTLLARLEPTGKSLPAQEQADFQAAYQLYAQGLQGLEAGILDLEHYIELQRHSRAKLEIPPLAIERIRSGLEALRELTEMANNL